MQHKTSKALFAYWDSVRAGRVAPHRFEIDPSKISAILPYTFILERIDAETYRFRLAGTRMCEIFGQELRGTNFLDGWEVIDRLPLLRQFSSLTRQGSVGVAHIEVCAYAEEAVPCETLLLPIRHTHDTIDRVLGSFVPMTSPNWLGEMPVTRKSLLINEVIWPSKDPLATISRPEGIEPPVLASPGFARTVRAERRQFRVYEGGLSRTDWEKS
jgi:hypothetical protein